MLIKFRRFSRLAIGLVFYSIGRVVPHLADFPEQG